MFIYSNKFEIQLGGDEWRNLQLVGEELGNDPI